MSRWLPLGLMPTRRYCCNQELGVAFPTTLFSEVGCSTLTDRQKKARIAAIWTRTTGLRASTTRENYRSGGEPCCESRANHRVLRLAPQHGPNPLSTVHCRSPFHQGFAETQPAKTLIRHLSGSSNACCKAHVCTRTSIRRSENLHLFILQTDPVKGTRSIGHLVWTERITDAPGHSCNAILRCPVQGTQG